MLARFIACVCLGGVLVFASGSSTVSLAQAPSAAVPADHAARMAKGTEIFKQHVRPVLLKHCVKCHGGDVTESEFDLTDRDLLLKGGALGPAVVPGQGRRSLLYKLVAREEEPYMPHEGSKLPEADIARIADWIDCGAPYDQPLVDKNAQKVSWTEAQVPEEAKAFWSFRPLADVQPPEVKDAAWCRTPIDRFILARLEAKGLYPNPLADRRTLLRRAYYDLIGLPPTPEDVDEFVLSCSPAPAPPHPRGGSVGTPEHGSAGDEAYAALIDRLLASPHYGERWARHWLDVARFAESHGYEQDYDRPHAYHYRDFVIKAFNDDLPYDTFVRWQVAGDELAPENPLALMATGFLAAGTHATQITANTAEKERYDELDDMARTLTTATLGLTVGCARCHDHKFDPIPSRDYYRLIAAFSTTVRSDLDINLEPEAYRDAKEKFDREHAPLAEALARYERDVLPEKLDPWLAVRQPAAEKPAWLVLEPVSSRSKGSATITPLGDGSLLLSRANPDNDALTFTAQVRQRGLKALRIEALAHPTLVRGGPGRADNGNFALSDVKITAAPLEAKDKAVEVKLAGARATFEQRGLPAAAAIDADKRSAWAVDPQFGRDHALVVDFDGEVGFEGGTLLTIVLEFNNNKRHAIGRPRLAVTTVRAAPLDGEAMPQSAQGVLAALEADPNKQLTPAERTHLLAWFRTTDPEWRRLHAAVQEHAQREPKPNTVRALISSEGVPAVRLHTQGADFYDPTYFLKRGEVSQKEGVAPAGFLQVLMRSPEDERRWRVEPPRESKLSYRRTALANWLCDTECGAGQLLARVIVNRLWQHHLGRGIVATPSDFGAQGARPTHPELLDYLARELIAGGWRLKPIHKLIMTSAVYMQGDQHDAARARLDVANELLWRRAPRRLEAEVIRDAMLAASGQLDATLFGPGTLDPNHRRRSIYFFVKRSKLVPMMVLFDGPDTLGGLDRRATTTVAPQSLMVMNSPQVRGYAEALARRMAPAAETALADAVRRGYLACVSRPPSEAELADAVAFIEEQMTSYGSEKKSDARLLALADFAQVLLGLNEFIYVD